MTERTRDAADPAAALYCSTIVVGSAVTKLDALAIVALVADSRVDGQRTVRPHVPLAPGSWVEIEIPKFGEPPPLAIDVYSDRSDEQARLQALTLLGQLEAATPWNLRLLDES